jgi:hypothetical protein
VSEKYKFKIVPDVNCVFVKHYGSITLKSIRARSAEIEAHELYTKNLNRLVDCRGCVPDLTVEDMKAIGVFIQDQSSRRGTYTEVLLISGVLEHGFVRVMGAMVPMESVTYNIIQENDSELALKSRSALKLSADFALPDFVKIN